MFFTTNLRQPYAALKFEMSDVKSLLCIPLRSFAAHVA
jgi:hypothetical protein